MMCYTLIVEITDAYQNSHQNEYVGKMKWESSSKTNVSWICMFDYVGENVFAKQKKPFDLAWTNDRSSETSSISGHFWEIRKLANQHNIGKSSTIGTGTVSG